eukprot:12191223-Karenia_brevis.AAC.1
MVAEQESSSGGGLPKADEKFWIQMKMLLDRMFDEKARTSSRKEQSEERRKIVFDEKQFRRMDKVAGD